MSVHLRRISATIPEHVAEALDRFIEQDPTNPPRSRIIAEALVRYISSFYPELVRRADGKEQTVVATLKSARPRTPFPTLRRTPLNIPKWKLVES